VVGVAFFDSEGVMNAPAWAEKLALESEIADVEARVEDAVAQGASRSAFDRRLKILRGSLAGYTTSST
jgi:hypothetical protein